MNCKPGDLAVVVRSDAPENIGVIVTVLALHDFIPSCWYVALHGRAVAANSPARRQAGLGGRKVRADDSALRPIRDPGEDATDETLDWLPVPVKEHA